MVKGECYARRVRPPPIRSSSLPIFTSMSQANYRCQTGPTLTSRAPEPRQLPVFLLECCKFASLDPAESLLALRPCGATTASVVIARSPTKRCVDGTIQSFDCTSEVGCRILDMCVLGGAQSVRSRVRGKSRFGCGRSAHVSQPHVICFGVDASARRGTAHRAGVTDFLPLPCQSMQHHAGIPCRLRGCHGACVFVLIRYLLPTTRPPWPKRLYRRAFELSGSPPSSMD